MKETNLLYELPYPLGKLGQTGKVTVNKPS